MTMNEGIFNRNKPEKFEIANPEVIRLINSSTEYTGIMDNMRYEKNAYPFIILSKNGKLYVGENGSTHSSVYEYVMRKYKFSENDFDIKKDINGRIFGKRFIVVWGAQKYNNKSIDIYKNVYQTFKNQSDINVSRYLVPFQVKNGVVKVAELKDVINGKPIISYNEYEKQETKGFNIAKTGYENFANLNDPDDDDYKRRERMNIWYGREVSENVTIDKKKTIKKSIVLKESDLRMMIQESLKQAINEIYSFNGYFDTEIDLDDCFGMYVDNEEFYNNGLHVRVYFKYMPASSGDYDVPGTDESYYYKSCEPEQNEWNKLVELSGLGEEKLREILDDYLYGNIDELIK